MRKLAQKHYLLAVLLVIFAFNSVDGQTLGLVLQEIKADLHLTDTQLGVLSGIAFALFYSVMGLPIARWADSGNRVMIISVTTALWSVAVALCGIAGNFVQLLTIRIAVAVGEAGCFPPAQSLIADHFARAERPRATAIYMLGSPLSVVIGYFLAGWLNQFYGWRVTFIVLGLPGLALAVLAWLTLREPRLEEIQKQSHAEAANTSQACTSGQVKLSDVCTTLWKKATFRHLLLSSSVGYFFGTGIAQWLPAFVIRSYGLNTGELGTWFAVIYGISATVGTYCGGAWASSRAANNERLQLETMSKMYLIIGLVSSLTYLSPNLALVFAFIGLTALGMTTTSGPMFATIQTLVPINMRATAIAIIFLLSNLIGAGLGPLAVGALSDALRPLAGEDSLRYALLAMCPGYLWCGWHLWRASRTVEADLVAMHFARNEVVSHGHKVENASTEVRGG